jgi:hypothetical protein
MGGASTGSPGLDAAPARAGFRLRHPDQGVGVGVDVGGDTGSNQVELIVGYDFAMRSVICDDEDFEQLIGEGRLYDYELGERYIVVPDVVVLPDRAPRVSMRTYG